jgi:hypothetical protein
MNSLGPNPFLSYTSTTTTTTTSMPLLRSLIQTAKTRKKHPMIPPVPQSHLTTARPTFAWRSTKNIPRSDVVIPLDFMSPYSFRLGLNLEAFFQALSLKKRKAQLIKTSKFGGINELVNIYHTFSFPQCCNR